jgi:hypothetical protein
MFRQVPAPRYDLKDQSVFKGAGCETGGAPRGAPNATVRQIYLLDRLWGSRYVPYAYWGAPNAIVRQIYLVDRLWVILDMIRMRIAVRRRLGRGNKARSWRVASRQNAVARVNCASSGVANGRDLGRRLPNSRF